METILSKNLIRFRKKKGWSQEEAAIQFSIKRSALGSYEEGRATPRLNTLLNICEVLDITDIKSFAKVPDYERNYTPKASKAVTHPLVERYNKSDPKFQMAVDILLSINK